MSYDAPFAGLRMLEATQGVAEPSAAMLLAQYCADVVKVGPPAGDWSRTLGTRSGEHSALTGMHCRWKVQTKLASWRRRQEEASPLCD